MSDALSEYNRMRSVASNLKATVSKIVSDKLETEASLANLTASTRGNRFSAAEYADIVRRQNNLRNKLVAIQKNLSQAKNDHRIACDELERAYQRAKLLTKDCSSKCIELIGTLRMKYASFSEDHTRVASMRMMASKFVNELEEIINTAKRDGTIEKDSME